jgi:hypothetical protein
MLWSLEMKMCIIELAYNGARIKKQPRRYKKGFYLLFGKEVLSGPFITKALCAEARSEWIMPGQRVQAY